ncbi:uncharacterized protein TNCV_3334331 [Trichonephila clavipes]|nr:uncharacterized protein TNCV_3334331 [Trichonephila clavipes]
MGNGFLHDGLKRFVASVDAGVTSLRLNSVYFSSQGEGNKKFSVNCLNEDKVFYNVTCGSDLMQVTLNLTNHPASIVYLQNLKGYPGCEPKAKDNLVIFQLSLNESGTHCGVSKMLNKQSGHNIFYQRVVIEKSNQKEKDLLFLQCVIPGDFNMEFVRLDWLRESVPYNFSEPTSSPISVTPDIVPYVNMAIRDKGLQLDTSAIVHPGTMLDLLIYLDKESSAHYDISLRYLTLSDATRSQEEVVVMNGCSVDPFVLDVFPSIDGVLRSQFRAFKFQSSDFVIFLATVSVCLQQCVEVRLQLHPPIVIKTVNEQIKFNINFPYAPDTIY